MGFICGVSVRLKTKFGVCRHELANLTLLNFELDGALVSNASVNSVKNKFPVVIFPFSGKIR